MIGLLLGFGKTPGWFALAGLPVVDIGAFAALTQFVIPEMEDRGLQLITDVTKEYAQIDLSLNNRSCIAALFVAVLMQLGTFYVFLLFSCLTGGIDNENPRVERQMLFLSPQGSFLGRLYAAHQNQSENVTCFEFLLPLSQLRVDFSRKALQRAMSLRSCGHIFLLARCTG